MFWIGVQPKDLKLNPNSQNNKLNIINMHVKHDKIKMILKTKKG